jgi:hypothetical protein
MKDFESNILKVLNKFGPRNEWKQKVPSPVALTSARPLRRSSSRNLVIVCFTITDSSFLAFSAEATAPEARATKPNLKTEQSHLLEKLQRATEAHTPKQHNHKLRERERWRERERACV